MSPSTPVAPDLGNRQAPRGTNALVKISAGVDYGLRVLCTLAVAERTMTARELAVTQDLPFKFLESTLNDLRRGEILTSSRGLGGGYRLARPADEISLYDVMEALVGTLAEVRGQLPETTAYEGAAVNLQDVWIVLRSTLQSALELVTIRDVVSGELDSLASLGTGLEDCGAIERFR